jgi:hypothetical protein
VNKFLIIFILLFTIVDAYAESNTCIVCHTDENMLKKFVKIPKLENTEGEG